MLHRRHQNPERPWFDIERLAGASGPEFVFAQRSPARNVRFGAHTEKDIAFAAPTGLLYSKLAEDGVLPTIFSHRVFISFSEQFVMFDRR